MMVNPPLLITNCFLVLIFAGGIAPAGATRGLSDRPLDPFGYSAFIVKVNV